MFIAIAVSIVVKAFLGGTSTLLLFIVGVAIVAFVQAFRMYAGSFLWGRQAVAKVKADFLCMDGPYAYVRNPLYLGNFLIGTGLCVAVNEWYAYVLFVVSYAFVYSIVIPYEEKFLQEKFGDVYANYKVRTGRFLPKLKGYASGNTVIPNFKEGILGEIHVPIILSIIFFGIYFLFVR